MPRYVFFKGVVYKNGKIIYVFQLLIGIFRWVVFYTETWNL